MVTAKHILSSLGDRILKRCCVAEDCSSKERRNTAFILRTVVHREDLSTHKFWKWYKKILDEYQKMTTIENEYYLRTILLLCEGGSYIAKQVIARELPKHGGDLDALLKRYENNLRHEFHRRQMEKLFPNNGYDKTDIDKWDIQMLIGVMLCLFRSTLSNEEKQKLREIKLVRHEILAHSPTAALYQQKYQDVTDQLREAINQLASQFDQSVKDKCKTLFANYASGPLDVQSAVQRLQEAKDTDRLFRKVIKVIQNAQAELSKELHEVEGNVRQDLKVTKKKLSTKIKSAEEVITREVRDATQTILKGVDGVKSDVKESKQELAEEIKSAERSIGHEVRCTRKALTIEIEKINGEECNTYKALMNVNNQIKDLHELLQQNMKERSRDCIDTSKRDLQKLAANLQAKSVEVEHRILTYDKDTSQALDGNQAAKMSLFPDMIQTLHVHTSAALLVAAIDFGTTYSGYAFSFRHEFETDPLRIHIDTFVNCLRVSFKVPTAVLFDTRKQFHSFGYEAENKYSDLAEDDEHRNWYFFRRFKMELYTRKVDRNTMLQADNGETMTAIDVFGSVIKYFKDHLRYKLQCRGCSVPDNEIRWILTVPAIWTDGAKQFMREAAITAGIDGRNLSIALEPEAASIYCQTIPKDTDQQSDHRFATIHSGTKYMVIDLGGGTVDITVHEKQSDGGLREICKASGGPWGGTKVDEEFDQLLVSVVGKEVFEKFCKEYKESYLVLQRELETKKKYNPCGKMKLRIPYCFNDICKEVKGKDIETAVSESIYDGKMTWRDEKLRLNLDVWIGLFKPCSENIVRHISSLLEDDPVKGTNMFFMVGGFSNCEIIQNAVKSAFPSVKVIIPEDVDLAVLRGAVIFGHRSMAITSRVSKYTYGISISPLFDRYIHPEDRRVSINGQDRCRDVFKKYINAGENVRVGDARSGEHATLLPRQKEMKLKMYKSTRQNPMYVDEEDTEYIGDVVVNLPKSDEQIVVIVKMMFGGTELMVEATELSQGTNYSSYFDFL